MGGGPLELFAMMKGVIKCEDVSDLRKRKGATEYRRVWGSIFAAARREGLVAEEPMKNVADEEDLRRKVIGGPILDGLRYLAGLDIDRMGKHVGGDDVISVLAKKEALTVEEQKIGRKISEKYKEHLTGELYLEVINFKLGEHAGPESSCGNDKKFNTSEIALQVMGKQKFLTFRDNEEVRYYFGGVYCDNGEARIKELVREVCEGKESTNLCGEVIGKIQRATYVDRQQLTENAEHKVVIINGILDLDTYEIRPHSPDFYALTQFPLKFKPGAQCPLILKFLSEVLRQEDIPVLQEWLGYHLWTSGYPAQKAMMFVGDGGNGKSTVIFVVECFVGKKNRAAISLHSLEENRFAPAGLYGKVANLYADLPDRDLKYVGQFKMATGGDPMRAEFKNINAFFFTNTAKLTFSCNKVPKVPEDSTGFFRRWIIIEFPNCFEGSADEDKDLKEKLATDEELSGLLNWAIEGLKRLRGNGWHFSNGKTVEKVREDYIVRSDPLKAFVMHCIDTEGCPDNVIGKQELFTAFKKHCEVHKIAPMSADSFFKKFKFEMPPGAFQYIRPNKGGNREHSLKGISLRPDENWCKPEFFEDVDRKYLKRSDSLDSRDQTESDESNESTLSAHLPVDTFQKFAPQLENYPDSVSDVPIVPGERLSNHILKEEESPPVLPSTPGHTMCGRNGHTGGSPASPPACLSLDGVERLFRDAGVSYELSKWKGRDTLATIPTHVLKKSYPDLVAQLRAGRWRDAESADRSRSFWTCKVDGHE